MNKIEELRNYADNLKIKNEVKNDTLKRYKNLVDKLALQNKRLNNLITELEKFIDYQINCNEYNSIDEENAYKNVLEILKGERK